MLLNEWLRDPKELAEMLGIDPESLPDLSPEELVKYFLDRLKEALQGRREGAAPTGAAALAQLWEAIQGDRTGTGLSIEVWSAARRDSEIKRRAARMQRDARQLVAKRLPEVLGAAPDAAEKLETMATLILATVNGLAVTEYLEGGAVEVKDAYDLLIQCLKTGANS